MPETLKTDRLILRPLRMEDAPALVAGAGDLEVSRRVTRIPHPYTRAHAETFLADQLGHDRPVWAITEAGGLAGLIGLIGASGEFGYWLARAVWGRGYMTEAGAGVLAHVFADPLQGPVESGHFADNGASARVLVKLGFGYTGAVESRSSRATGLSQPLRRMILTPEQWHAAQPWIIRTPRLMLRPLARGDVGDIARIGGDARVAPMILAATVPWPEDRVRRFLEAFRWRGRLPFRLAVTREGQCLGTVGAAGRPDGSAEVFYFLDPVAWGQGS